MRNERKKLSPSEQQTAIAEYCGGKTACEVADLFGVNSSTVLSNLQRHGIDRRPAVPRGVPMPDDIEDLLRDESVPLDQIAEMIGASLSTVHRWKRQLGIPSRPRGGSRKK